jgi:hypothetical protein
LPIIFGQTVFDRQYRVFGRPFFVKIDKLFAAQDLSFAFQIVFAVFKELCCGTVNRKSDVGAWNVIGRFDRLEDDLDGSFIVR